MYRIKPLIIITCFIISSISYAQDTYHLNLIEMLNQEYRLPEPSYILGNNESTNRDALSFYGQANKTYGTIDSLPFQLVTNINVTKAGANIWDSGAGAKNSNTIDQNDAILFVFWAKGTSADAEISPFIENATTYAKEFYQPLDLSQEWQQYFIPIKSSSNFGVGRLSIGFHLAAKVQQMSIGGVTVLDFGKNVKLEDLPTSFEAGAYGGAAADAPWRALAANRIDSIRKSDLKITVVDKNNIPIPNADVHIEMLKHDFGFGSALVTCRFPGNSCYDPTYIDKLTNLDGKGHGFNVAVTENDLKWDAWEERWFSTPEENVNAIQYIADLGIKMRGHTLFWPGFQYLPDDIRENRSNLPYLRNRIDERINNMITHPTLRNLIRDWDVLNEITVNRDFENAFKADPTFTTGREVYHDIMSKVRSLDPTVGLYINDYVVLSGGGQSTVVQDRYKQFLDEINAGPVKMDGIGFQCHMGNNLTSINRIKSVFDEYSGRYDVRLKVTEFDMEPNTNPELAGRYMEDFLTMTFSHPAMDAFLMWGFWDGNHFKNSGPLYDINWNLKPSGQAFIDKVFGEWWTDEMSKSDINGQMNTRVFKGQHRVKVNYEGTTQTAEVTVRNDREIVLQMDVVVGTNDLQAINPYKVFPNPSSDSFTIYTDGALSLPAQLSIFDTTSRQVYSTTLSQDEQVVYHTLPSGSYQLILKSESLTINLPITIIR